MIRKPAPSTPDAPRSARPVPVQRQQPFRPGQRLPGRPEGGGGPENTGATRNEQAANIPLFQSQPSWKWEFENDFVGVARPTDKPDLSGGAGFHTMNELPSNAFRQLGDRFGGRQ